MIPKDKLLHAAAGVATVVGVLIAFAIYAWFGLGPALAYATTAVGVLYEAQQWYRKEGQPDVWDAVTTAAPGWIAWALLEVGK